MQFIPTDIEGVIKILPKRFGDPRGYFCETWRRDLFEQAIGHPVNFVQDNESVSGRGVLRGLHFQQGDASQGKLVRVSRGRIVDVVVDLRRGSASFGRHVAVELSAESGLQLWVPRGMAHGFVVLSDMAQFQYKVDRPYAPAAEATLRFDDPALGINWPIPSDQMLLSPKDLDGRTLDELLQTNTLPNA